MTFAPQRLGDRAGLAVFADEAHHYFVGVQATAAGTALVVTMRKGTDDP